MTATNIFYNFVGFRYSPPLRGLYTWVRSVIVTLCVVDSVIYMGTVNNIATRHGMC